VRNRILIKIGGRAFEGESGFRELAAAIAATPDIEVIMVHGGGAEISTALKAANRPTEFIDGIRVTQAEDIRIVEQVLSGTVNARIAAWLTKNDISCRRMSGKTDGMLVAEPLRRGGRDYGFVGQIKRVAPIAIETALKEGCIPVISPISADEAGTTYNVNADSAAAALAAATGCTALVFVTDVAGVMVAGEPVAGMTSEQAIEGIATGQIKGGMVAKIESAVQALEKGVDRIYIGVWHGADTLKKIAAGNRSLKTWLRP
jgi:acetylglutamate kinase